MDIDRFLKASFDLYYAAPGFFNSVPLLVGGYIAFLWSGYGLGRWVQQSEIASLKAINELSKAQTETLKSASDILKEKVGVLDERVKLAKEQADEAKKKAEEFKAEADKLRKRIEANAPSDELKSAFYHLDQKAANILSANNAISSTLTPTGSIYRDAPKLIISQPLDE
jgi:hypothetical protein